MKRRSVILSGSSRRGSFQGCCCPARFCLCCWRLRPRRLWPRRASARSIRSTSSIRSVRSTLRPIISSVTARAWPRAISDFDRALILRPNDVEILVLRAAAWRNARNPTRALDDAAHALRIAPDHSEALLERGFASLVLGERNQANNDFNKVLR